MQLHGNDFADLKYFEPGEHLTMAVTVPRPPKLNSSNVHSNTFDHSKQLARALPNTSTAFNESYSNLRKDSYSQLSDTQHSQQRSIDNRSSRMQMISQAVHRYDSAIKKAERANFGQNNTGIKQKQRGPMQSFEEPGAINAMHSSFQIGRINGGYPVSILKKKSTSNVDDSFCMSLNEKERGSQPRFGIKLLPTEIEEKIVLENARAPENRGSSPIGYQYLRNKRASDCSFNSHSDNSRALSQQHQHYDSKSRGALLDENRYRHHRINTVSDVLFPHSYDYGRDDLTREKQCHTGNFVKHDSSSQSPKAVPRHQPQQKLYTLASGGGSDYNYQNNESSLIGAQSSYMLAGSKTQESFSRQQHEALVKSMSNQIQRQNDRKVQEKILNQSRSQFKDSQISHQTSKQNRSLSRKEQIKEEIRQRELLLERDKQKLRDIEAQSVARGRAQDFREILKGNGSSISSPRSGSFNSRKTLRKSPMTRALQHDKGMGLRNPQPYDPLDHDISKYERGICPLRYKIQNNQQNRNQNNELTGSNYKSAQKEIQQHDDLMLVDRLDMRINNKIRNLSEENKYDFQSNNRKIRMQDKIQHLKKEFDVMFSPKNRSNRVDNRRTLQSLSLSCDDLNGQYQIQRSNKDIQRKYESRHQQQPTKTAESTANFNGFLLHDKLMGSTAPLIHSSANQEIEYSKSNHFTLGEQAKVSSPHQQLILQSPQPTLRDVQTSSFHQRSKSAHIVYHSNKFKRVDEGSFQDRINHLSNTFLGNRMSPTNLNYGSNKFLRTQFAPQDPRNTSGIIPALDAKKLKYQKNEIETEEVEMLADESIPLFENGSPQHGQRNPKIDLMDPNADNDLYPPQIVVFPCVSGEQQVTTTNAAAISSPTKSTIHQVITKSPPNMNKNAKKSQNNRSNSSSKLTNGVNLSTQILLNKERLKRLLRDDSNPNNRRQVKKNRNQQTSISSKSRGAVGSRCSISNQYPQQQTDQNISQSNLLDSQATTTDYVQSQAPHHLTQGMPVAPSLSLHQPSTSLHQMSSTSQTPMSNKHTKQPALAQKQHQQQQSQGPLGHQTSISEMCPQATPFLVDEPCNLEDNNNIVIANPNDEPPIGNYQDVQQAHGSTPFQEWQVKSLPKSHDQNLNTSKPLNQNNGTQSSFKANPDDYAQFSNYQAAEVEKERARMQEEVALLKQEVSRLQDKIKQKEQKRLSNQEREQALLQPVQDKAIADDEKLKQQIDSYRLIFQNKYKQKYERKLVSERERNQSMIDNLKVELENIQLKYGKRMAKMEQEIKAAAATQLKELEQKYKEREMKLTNKYEKKMRELQRKMHDLQSHNIQAAQKQHIEQEVKLRVDQIINEKDAMIGAAQQKVGLLEKLLELKQIESNKQQLVADNSSISSPPGDATTVACSAHNMKGQDNHSTLAESAHNFLNNQISANNGNYNPANKNQQEAQLAVCSSFGNAELSESQANQFKLEPPVSSIPSQRSFNMHIKQPKGTQQLASSEEPSNRLQKHQRSKSMTLNGSTVRAGKRNNGPVQQQKSQVISNETLKSWEQARNIIDLSSSNVISPSAANVDQKQMNKFLQQIRSNQRAPHQQQTDLIASSFIPSQQIHSAGETILSSRRIHKKTTTILKKPKPRPENMKPQMENIQVATQKFPSHFVQHNSANCAALPTSSSRTNMSTQNGKLLQDPAISSGSHYQNNQNRLNNAINQVNGPVLFDQSQSFQNNLAVTNDTALQHPLVLQVFEPTEGRHSTDSEGPTFSEKEIFQLA